MAPKNVFVTVGSTRFDDMITEICKSETLEVFADKGYGTVTVQLGHGKLPKSVLGADGLNKEDTQDQYDTYLSNLHDGNSVTVDFALQKASSKLTMTLFRFKPNISSEMSKADLVVSHAGAGSSLEALTLNKPLVTVINDNLMDNHQTELAEQLASMGCSVACRPCQLVDTLAGLDESTLERYVPGDPTKFMAYLGSKFVTLQ